VWSLASRAGAEEIVKSIERII
jgi:hypothetical protein